MSAAHFMAMLTGSGARRAVACCAPSRSAFPKSPSSSGQSAAEGQGLVKAFESAWPALGWINGKTIQIDYRWAPPALLLAEVIDMVASAPMSSLSPGCRS